MNIPVHNRGGGRTRASSLLASGCSLDVGDSAYFFRRYPVRRRPVPPPKNGHSPSLSNQPNSQRRSIAEPHPKSARQAFPAITHSLPGKRSLDHR